MTDDTPRNIGLRHFIKTKIVQLNVPRGLELTPQVNS